MVNSSRNIGKSRTIFIINPYVYTYVSGFSGAVSTPLITCLGIFICSSPRLILLSSAS